MKIAFIGLGIMGRPMASHLQEAGHDVIGYDLAGDYADLTSRGGSAAESIAHAVSQADVVAIMVPDSPDVSAVVNGPEGVFAHARTGTLIIDFSSIRPDVAISLEAAARERGLKMIDAPVSGGEPGAIAASLSIMVGGAEEDFVEALPILEVVGSTVVHVGPPGSGQTVKAANQLIVASNIQAVAEAILFLEAYGVEMEAAVEVLGGGLAGSAVLTQKAQKILEREFSPGFRIDLHHKDMGIVTSAAREAGVPLPVGAVVAQLVAAARSSGYGDDDHSGLFQITENMGGKPGGGN